MDTRSVYRKTSILSGARQTSVFQRLTAKAIDVLLVTALYLFGKALWLPVGVLAAASFAAVQDALGDGQSVGKRIIGLRVIDEYTGMGCSLQNSFLRNLPLSLFFVCAPFEILSGMCALLVTPLVVLEIYLLFQVDTGVRLGDVIANTLVVEYFEEPIGTEH
jgi:uncharacterized RDD family membrane protein YckC